MSRVKRAHGRHQGEPFGVNPHLTPEAGHFGGGANDRGWFVQLDFLTVDGEFHGNQTIKSAAQAFSKSTT